MASMFAASSCSGVNASPSEDIVIGWGLYSSSSVSSTDSSVTSSGSTSPLPLDLGSARSSSP